MTNEEVMNLLTDMGLHDGGIKNWIPDNAWVRVVNKAVEIEREACAKVVEEWLHGDWHNQGVVAAAMIRARGEK